MNENYSYSYRSTGRVDDTQPDITVVIPLFQQADYVTELFENIVGQSYLGHGTMEIIVVDDHTPDNSKTSRFIQLALREMQPSTIPNLILKVFELKETAGIPSAQRFGISQAEAPIVAYADPGDLIDPDFVTKKAGTHLADEDGFGQLAVQPYFLEYIGE